MKQHLKVLTVINSFLLRMQIYNEILHYFQVPQNVVYIKLYWKNYIISVIQLIISGNVKPP